MSGIESNESLKGIHSELKRLNTNIESIISKVDDAIQKDIASDSFIQSKVESVKRNKKIENILVGAMAVGIVALILYEKVLKYFFN
jgi:hypothetical protein